MPTPPARCTNSGFGEFSEGHRIDLERYFCVMPILKDDVLLKQLKSAQWEPLYFLYGEETLVLEKAVGLLLKKAVDPAFESFNLQRFDGESLAFNDLQTAYDALPMMAPYKCITVKDWNLEKVGKQEFSLFCQMLEDPNPSTILVLFYTRQELEVKKGSKFKKAMELFQKKGVVCEFGLKDKAALKKDLISYCAKGKVTLPPEVCDKLIDQCGSQLTILRQEADKLIAYAGAGGTVTAQAVDALCIKTVQNTAFDLSNAILQHQYGRAFSILDHLFFLRTEPVLILGALNMSFIDLYRVKTAQTAGLSAAQVVRDFKYRSQYRVTKLYKDVARFSLEQIRSCIGSLEKADRLIKSSRMEPRLVLEQMLGEMMVESRGGRRP